MFLQISTPDTSGYMIAGYAIAFLVMGLYIASIYLRSRNLYQDQAMLEEMDKKSAPKPSDNAKQTVPKKAETVTKKSKKK